MACPQTVYSFFLRGCRKPECVIAANTGGIYDQRSFIISQVLFQVDYWFRTVPDCTFESKRGAGLGSAGNYSHGQKPKKKFVHYVFSFSIIFWVTIFASALPFDSFITSPT